MQDVEVAIVGGGPAGAACAGELRRRGVECVVLDRAAFPREKLCAGWITPRCARAVGLASYPGGVREVRRFRVALRGRSLALRVRQFSIRRVEFDAWFLRQSGAPVAMHDVRRVRREGNGFVLDDAWRCRFVVGAGGTGCPVYRELFAAGRPRIAADRIAAMEEEFAWPDADGDGDCRLWFGEDGLPGYAWLVPKAGGFVNAGIGGYAERMRAAGTDIAAHWARFQKRLAERGLVRGREFARKGCVYYLRDPRPAACDGAYLVGDAAGLATRDLGEGIGPAVESGRRAAAAIATGRPLSFAGIPRWSLPGLILSGWLPAGAGGTRVRE
jgi:flavin-dependent dehydrogenase